MNSNRNVICMLAIAALVMLAAPASAEIVTSAVYNPATQQIEYSITGGEAVLYDIKAYSIGCADTVTAPPDITGPDATGFVDITCLNPGTGKITLEFCVGVLCFSIIDVYVRCNADCSIVTGTAVPAHNDYGLFTLLGLLLVSGIVVMRRRH